MYLAYTGSMLAQKGVGTVYTQLQIGWEGRDEHSAFFASLKLPPIHSDSLQSQVGEAGGSQSQQSELVGVSASQGC